MSKRKNRIVLLLSAFIFIIGHFNHVYAYQYYVDTSRVSLTSGTREELEEMFFNLANEYYKHSEDTDLAIINLTVTKEQDEYGNPIYVVGKGENTFIWTPIPTEFLFDTNGEREIGETWEIWAEIQYQKSDTTTCNVLIPQTYLDDEGDFDPEKLGWVGTKFFDDVTSGAMDVVTNVFGGISDFIIGVVDFGKNFSHNAVGTICTLLLDLLRTIFDAMQILINSIQTSTLHTVWDLQLTYSYNYLRSDRENGELMEKVDPESRSYDSSAGNRDIYTKVSNFRSEDYKSYDEQKYIYINGESFGFSMNTEIPVIPVDVYNLGVGDIGFIDINFLSGDETHEEGSPWMILRNIAVTILHITLYLAAAFLIITLIWNGIHIVKGSIDNPESYAERKKGIQRFFVSVLMLVGSVVIMALCIFASQMFLGDLKSEKHELPIRVNVSMSSEDGDIEGYSFSTNFTGYVRYMSQIEDVDMYAQKAVYVFEYIALVIVNVLGGIFMVLRMVIMLFLAILGPIAAAMNALNIDRRGILNYRTWAELYISLAAVQIFLAIASRIVLECSIFN